MHFKDPCLYLRATSISPPRKGKASTWNILSQMSGAQVRNTELKGSPLKTCKGRICMRIPSASAFGVNFPSLSWLPFYLLTTLCLQCLTQCFAQCGRSANICSTYSWKKICMWLIGCIDKAFEKPQHRHPPISSSSHTDSCAVGATGQLVP